MFYRDTWAEINLDALRHNCREIQKLTNKKMIAVLKANAYGHCDYWVAKTAMEEGAAMVAVAYLDEALSLRKQGFTRIRSYSCCRYSTGTDSSYYVNRSEFGLAE